MNFYVFGEEEEENHHKGWVHCKCSVLWCPMIEEIFAEYLRKEKAGFIPLIPSWVTPQKRRLLQANVIKANVVVAQDGTGKYKTITEALNEVPKKNAQPFVIHIKQGVYVETVRVLKTMTNVVFIGDGPLKTKVTGKRSFGGGYKTIDTATVAVMGDGFVAKNIV